MIKKAKHYYIGAGILFIVSGLASKRYAISIVGVSLIIIGFSMGKKDNNNDNEKNSD